MVQGDDRGVVLPHAAEFRVGDGIQDGQPLEEAVDVGVGLPVAIDMFSRRFVGDVEATGIEQTLGVEVTAKLREERLEEVEVLLAQAIGSPAEAVDGSVSLVDLDPRSVGESPLAEQVREFEDLRPACEAGADPAVEESEVEGVSPVRPSRYANELRRRSKAPHGGIERGREERRKQVGRTVPYGESHIARKQFPEGFREDGHMVGERDSVRMEPLGELDFLRGQEGIHYGGQVGAFGTEPSVRIGGRGGLRGSEREAHLDGVFTRGKRRVPANPHPESLPSSRYQPGDAVVRHGLQHVRKESGFGPEVSFIPMVVAGQLGGDEADPPHLDPGRQRGVHFDAARNASSVVPVIARSEREGMPFVAQEDPGGPFRPAPGLVREGLFERAHESKSQ